MKEEISGRVKTRGTTVSKSTSLLGGILSLAAVFIPLGTAFVSDVEFDNVVSPWHVEAQNIYYPLMFGFLFSMYPLWVLFLWRLFGETEHKERERGRFLDFVLGQKKWEVLGANSTEKITEKIAEDDERTSIEFERYFSQIMKIVVDDPASKIVIAIDNLDRVEPEDALAIWSILQTFFQHRSTGRSYTEKDWQPKICFLIPYDRDGLSRVWSDERENINECTGAAQSFFEKCFQVIVEVPEPAVSGWIQFARQKIKEGLSEGWPDAEVEAVVDVFVRHESKLEVSPTPRQILSFVNRVGVLGLRWGGEMSAEAACSGLICLDTSIGGKST